MRIEETKNTMLADEVPEGQVFKRNDNVYMRVETPLTIMSDSAKLNNGSRIYAVNLSVGVMTWFGVDDEVEPVTEAKVIITP